MFDLERKNYLESNVDSKLTKLSVVSNELDVNNCLFSPELLAYLLRSNKDVSTYHLHSSKSHRKIYKNKEGIYLVAFSILNKEEKSLIYNYIYYNDLLYLSIIVYFLTRNYFITNDNHEWGKYLVILDNIYLNYNNVDNYFYLYSKDRSRN